MWNSPSKRWEAARGYAWSRPVFAQLPEDSRRKTYDSHAEGWASELGELAGYLDAV